jgi:hypothetical protein
MQGLECDMVRPKHPRLEAEFIAERLQQSWDKHLSQLIRCGFKLGVHATIDGRVLVHRERLCERGEVGIILTGSRAKLWLISGRLVRRRL